MTDFPLQSLLDDLLAFFERQGIEYLVMGGVAVRYWGVPRPTFDLDFTLLVEPERVPAVCVLLREAGFTVPEIHEKGFVDRLAGMNKFSVTRYEQGRAVSVDMFLVTTGYQREAFGRRVRRKINGVTAWLIAPEDLILHKLIAGRRRDRADVDDILLVCGTLEREYLRRWAGVLGVTALLEEHLRELA